MMPWELQLLAIPKDEAERGEEGNESLEGMHYIGKVETVREYGA